VAPAGWVVDPAGGGELELPVLTVHPAKIMMVTAPAASSSRRHRAMP
jgi:hypothetical protein